MVFIASLLGARHLGEVVKNKLVSSLVVSRHLTGRPHLYVEDGWPNIFPPKSKLLAGKASDCKNKNAML